MLFQGSAIPLMSCVLDGSVWQFSSINWHGLLEKDSVAKFVMLPSSRDDEVMFEIPFMAALLRQRDKYATRSTFPDSESFDSLKVDNIRRSFRVPVLMVGGTSMLSLCVRQLKRSLGRQRSPLA